MRLTPLAAAEAPSGRLKIFCLTATIVLFGQPALAAPPQLQFPVACEPKRTCFIQNYVDLDPSAGATDFQCGSLTYDGHNGTDIRLPTLVAQRAGVNVLAATGGRVLRTRDGVSDVSVRIRGAAAVQGSECGNGIIIDHGDGWETQYCHLAKGSVSVRSGDAVRAGQSIGQIGLSGHTEYPHLHFTVRRQGEVVDPFAFGAAPGTCAMGASLWAPEVRPILAYDPRAVLNFGFSSGAVTMKAIDAGEADRAPPGPDAPALVAFVRAIGLKAGDVQMLTLRQPDGQMLAETTTKPLDRDKAQWMIYVGRKRPLAGWTRGRYQANYTVMRDGAPVLSRAFDMTL